MSRGQPIPRGLARQDGGIRIRKGLRLTRHRVGGIGRYPARAFGHGHLSVGHPAWSTENRIIQTSEFQISPRSPVKLFVEHRTGFHCPDDVFTALSSRCAGRLRTEFPRDAAWRSPSAVLWCPLRSPAVHLSWAWRPANLPREGEVGALGNSASVVRAFHREAHSTGLLSPAASWLLPVPRLTATGRHRGVLDEENTDRGEPEPVARSLEALEPWSFALGERYTWPVEAPSRSQEGRSARAGHPASQDRYRAYWGA
jgi:hypothetical protein